MFSSAGTSSSDTQAKRQVTVSMFEKRQRTYDREHFVVSHSQTNPRPMTSVCKNGGEEAVRLYTIGTGVSMIYTRDYANTRR